MESNGGLGEGGTELSEGEMLPVRKGLEINCWAPHTLPIDLNNTFMEVPLSHFTDGETKAVLTHPRSVRSIRTRRAWR